MNRNGRAKRRQRQAAEPVEWLSQYYDEDGHTSPDSEIDGMAADSFPASDPPSFAGLRIGCPPADRTPRDFVAGLPPTLPHARQRRRSASVRAGRA